MRISRGKYTAEYLSMVLGTVGGRKAVLDDKQRPQAKAMMADKSLSVGDIAKTMGVSRSTLYRI